MTTTNTLERGLGRVLPLLAMLLLLACLLTLQAGAANTTTDDGFTIDRSYSYGSGYTITLTGYTGSSANVILPSTATISGTEYTVTTISDKVFKGNTAITSVTFSEGYTTIPSSAFSGCEGLKSVTLPTTMTRIGANAFENCTTLETVTFTSGGTDGLSFNGSVFAGCTSLKTFALPARTAAVGDNENIFRGCTALTDITVEAGNETYFTEDGLLYAKTSDTTATLAAYPFGKTEAVLTVPSTAGGLTVNALGPHLFRENTTLTQVTVPASVTTFDRFCFNGCSSLTKISLGCEAFAEDGLGSSAFTGLAANSVIEVANDTVAAALEPSDQWTSYYTAGTTTIRVASAEQKTVSAEIALRANKDLTEDGQIKYGLYLNSASYLSTLTLRLTFDANQVDEGTLKINSALFDVSNIVWTAEDGKLIADVYVGKTGDVTGLAVDKANTWFATVSVPVKKGVTGSITAALSNAAAAGVVDVTADAVKGTVTLANKSDTFHIASYDVNGDGIVDQVDITEAQRYYQTKTTDENWSLAQNADTNGDGAVDLQDLIEIFHAMLAASGT